MTWVERLRRNSRERWDGAAEAIVKAGGGFGMDEGRGTWKERIDDWEPRHTDTLTNLVRDLRNLSKVLTRSRHLSSSLDREQLVGSLGVCVPSTRDQ